MTGGFDLRVLGADDWELLRDLRLRSLADAPTAFGAQVQDARRLAEADWRGRADNGFRVVVVVDGTGRGVAVGGTSAPGSSASDDGAAEPAVQVWGMWTDPAARGQGLGARVLDDLVAWAREAAYDEVRLHVTEGNDAARRLYTGRGFVPTGAWVPLREGSPLRCEELSLRLAHG